MKSIKLDLDTSLTAANASYVALIRIKSIMTSTRLRHVGVVVKPAYIKRDFVIRAGIIDELEKSD